jgi:hypothetical protein
VCIKLATTCERGIEGHKEKEKAGAGGGNQGCPLKKAGDLY